MKNAVAAILLSLAVASPACAQGLSESIVLVSGGKTSTIKVALAETKAAAEAGLAGHAALVNGEGLLIDYRKADASLVPTMKGVAFDLDVIFVGPDGMVVATVQRARAGSLRPLWPGLRYAAAIEIPAGQVAALGVKPGDKVKTKAFGNAG